LPYQEKKINKNLTGYNVEILFYIMSEVPKEKIQTRRDVARAKKLYRYASAPSR